MKKIFIILLAMIFLSSCKETKMKTVEKVDINRFMGDWYVIAIIPNFIEKNAMNGIESYELLDDNRVKIDYRFTNKKTGKKKHLQPKAWIYDKKSFAEWRVQFVWPIKFPYLIIDLADDYSDTVIGVPNKKFVWIMSREPEMKSQRYDEIIKNLNEIGYDISKIKKMKQEWK